MRGRQDCTLIGLAILGALLAGCVTDYNARTTIGAKQTIPALTFARTAEGGSAPEPVDPPTTRLDRAGWETINYRLPVDGTAHAPIWRSAIVLGDSPRRQHGLYPTPESVLELGADAQDQLVLGFSLPIIALADVFLMPVWMIADPIWNVRQSPSMYKRWRSGEWLVGPMPESDGAQ